MKLEIPAAAGAVTVEIEPSRPVVLLGPNGTGKTRLGVYIDDLISSGISHRIAAQRSLEMPDEVFSEDYDRAIASLRRSRGDKKPKKLSPGSIEFNYDEVLTALFAQQYRALEYAHAASSGKATSKRPSTLIDRLQAIWADLIPYQRLIFSEHTIRVIRASSDGAPYEGAEMSDGERLIVYMLGQALLLSQESLLIVDEPELHMSRALLVRLWDAVERARPDCSFIYITHDIDFAASRRGARMYAVLDYTPPTFKQITVKKRKQTVQDSPPSWTLEALPSGSDVPLDVLARIVGSRKPILFVEGQTGGLDHLIYKAVYKDFTVMPVESCRQVIQLVRSFRMQMPLHWLHCAGLVDRDNRTVDAAGRLEDGLYALPVSEIENLLLIQDVFVALAEALTFPAREVESRFARLKKDVLDAARRQAERISLKQTSSRIWDSSRAMGVKAKDIAELTCLYEEMVTRTSPHDLYDGYFAEITRILEAEDFATVLQVYDNKGGLLNSLARSLGLHGPTELEAFVARLLLQERGSGLVKALCGVLPIIE
ncbi:DUF4435 domain-containing protein [Methylobacterium oryzihabitans]|uniref:DUF4435 domain-containing protein n=1 Tax=Methylobacterium oryzihabitans TaxID=2499852 RepID=A0A437P8B3_9HYPH|nr:DUF4435 domain-containing protein [Methylobacterium oryzihabitans]RVU18481.1 DUF4435 domain-containing protein [Methylobacterium oryzihabitans]